MDVCMPKLKSSLQLHCDCHAVEVCCHCMSVLESSPYLTRPDSYIIRFALFQAVVKDLAVGDLCNIVCNHLHIVQS